MKERCLPAPPVQKEECRQFTEVCLHSTWPPSSFLSSITLRRSLSPDTREAITPALLPCPRLLPFRCLPSYPPRHAWPATTVHPCRRCLPTVHPTTLLTLPTNNRETYFRPLAVCAVAPCRRPERLKHRCHRTMPPSSCPAREGWRRLHAPCAPREACLCYARLRRRRHVTRRPLVRLFRAARSHYVVYVIVRHHFPPSPMSIRHVVSDVIHLRRPTCYHAAVRYASRSRRITSDATLSPA